jgi:hypothetical protein
MQKLLHLFRLEVETLTRLPNGGSQCEKAFHGHTFPCDCLVLHFFECGGHDGVCEDDGLVEFRSHESDYASLVYMEENKMT